MSAPVSLRSDSSSKQETKTMKYSPQQPQDGDSKDRSQSAVRDGRQRQTDTIPRRQVIDRIAPQGPGKHSSSQKAAVGVPYLGHVLVNVFGHCSLRQGLVVVRLGGFLFGWHSLALGGGGGLGSGGRFGGSSILEGVSSRRLLL